MTTFGLMWLKSWNYHWWSANGKCCYTQRVLRPWLKVIIFSFDRCTTLWKIHIFITTETLKIGLLSGLARWESGKVGKSNSFRWQIFTFINNTLIHVFRQLLTSVCTSPSSIWLPLRECLLSPKFTYVNIFRFFQGFLNYFIHPSNYWVFENAYFQSFFVRFMDLT